MLRLTNSLFSILRQPVSIRYVSLFENHLEIKNEDSDTSKYHYFWLRDHCRCQECYNHKTHQINSDVLKIPMNITPNSCEKHSEKLYITWQDGHKTEFSLEWLRKIADNRRKSLNKTIFWNAAKLQKLEDLAVPYAEYMGQKEGLRKLLKSILSYGIGFVTNVTSSLEETENVVRSMAPIRKTVFGKIWEVTNDLAHEDTAYSTISLGPHNDNTYFTEASGLQIFHMLEKSGTGGETVLVDGFNAARNVKKKNPESYKILSTYPIESEYIGKGVHFTSVEPVLKLHPVTNNLLQIRYNIYDRAPLNTLTFDQVLPFYKAYRLLGDEINNEENQWWLKLQPGTVIFIDNWRVLHGRTAYTGKRKLTGCYVGRKDWMSTAKYLGLDLY